MREICVEFPNDRQCPHCGILNEICDKCHLCFACCACVKNVLGIDYDNWDTDYDYDEITEY